MQTNTSLVKFLVPKQTFNGNRKIAKELQLKVYKRNLVVAATITLRPEESRYRCH